MKHAWALCITAYWFFVGSIVAQPARDWDKTYGTWNWEELHLTVATPDGGYLIGGNTTSEGGDVSDEAYGLNDFWLLKIDAIGNIKWDKTFGGEGNDLLWDVLQLPDGGLLLGGSSDSKISGNKTSTNFGEKDFWVIRLSKTGEKIWEKTYGGSGRDELFSLNFFPDSSSFLLGGWSNSPADGVKTSDSLGVYDIWVLKIDQNGAIIWQTLLGGEGLDNLYDAKPTHDGGFLLGGASASNISPTKSQNCYGYSDFWVVKIDTAGNRVWDARYGGNDVEQLEQILALRDGNFLLAGASMSRKSGNKTSENYGSFDMWVVKINPEGEKIWDKSFGGESFDGCNSVVETPEGNLILGGTSASTPSGTKKSPNYGNFDFWITYTDAAGELLWEKSYGGSKSDALTSLVQVPSDGSLLLTGHSESSKSAFKSENPRGYNDFWLLKTHCFVQSNLPADTIFCSKSENLISANPTNCANGNCTVLWSNGQQGASILLVPDTTGVLSVKVVDGNACRSEDTMRYQVLFSPIVDLGQDTVLFEDAQPLYLSSFIPDVTYKWSDGSTQSLNLVSETGFYSLTVTAANGCTASDGIEVCFCGKRTLFIPNIFQPDNNVFNDVWYIQSRDNSEITLSKVLVQDRWGHTVYLAKDILPNDKSVGWDGSNQSRACMPGVYTYFIEFYDNRGDKKNIFGTVTLVR